MRIQERQREKPNHRRQQRMNSYEFLKPTLAIVLAFLLSIRPAQSGIGPAANITNLSTRAWNLGDPLDLPNSVAIAGFTITVPAALAAQIRAAVVLPGATWNNTGTALFPIGSQAIH